MRRAALAITLCLASTGYRPAASAETDKNSVKYAREVKMIIAKEHKKRRSDPKDDFERMHKLCGKSRGWTKGCRFWKGKGGKSQVVFEVRSSKKIYSVPGMFQ